MAIALLALLLSACAYFDRDGDRERLLARAGAQGWTFATVEAGPFTLFTGARRSAGASTLTVYIEGDGRSWRDPYTPSDDPTPARPLGLRLAMADPAPNILYLARPCQYQGLARSAGCDVAVWTTHRLAPEVISSLSAAIDRAKEARGIGSIELIGYSGGGSAAVLLAARRTDVTRIVTIAANLDLGLWARLARVRPLGGSLDPAAEARAVGHIPQVHLAGADDEIVPAAVQRSFASKARVDARAVREVTGYTHDCCWHEGWTERIAALRASLEAQPTR